MRGLQFYPFFTQYDSTNNINMENYKDIIEGTSVDEPNTK